MTEPEKMAATICAAILVCFMFFVLTRPRERPVPVVKPPIPTAQNAQPAGTAPLSANDHDALIRLLDGQDQVRSDLASFNRTLDMQNRGIDHIMSTQTIIVGLLVGIFGGAFYLWKQFIHLQDDLNHLYRQLGEVRFRDHERER